MNNSMQPFKNNAGNVIKLKKILVETITNILTQYYSLTIKSSGELKSCDDDYLTHKYIFSSIAFHGRIVGNVIISAEKKLAQYFLHQMDLGALSPEKEKVYIQDSMGELLNIVLGNTTNVLLDQNVTITIEPPVFIDCKEKDMGLVTKNSWIYELRTGQGKCCLILKIL